MLSKNCAACARERWNKDQKALLPENSRAVYTDGSGGPLGWELVFISETLPKIEVYQYTCRSCASVIFSLYFFTSLSCHH